MLTTIAIDPGKSGGWVISRNGIIKTGKLNPLSDFLEVMKCYNPETTIVYLEKLSGFVKGKARTGASMFVMGEYYFGPMWMLKSLGFHVELVTPQRWQGALRCGAHGNRTQTQWKNHLKDIAKSLYPDCKVVGWNADAYLILKYGLMRG